MRRSPSYLTPIDITCRNRANGLFSSLFGITSTFEQNLIALYDSAGSGNSLGVSGNYDRLPFAPYLRKLRDAGEWAQASMAVA